MWIESIMAAASGLVLLVTVFWHGWIEVVFGADPDHHDGTLEWGVVAVCLILTVTGFSLARYNRHKLSTDPT
jgi:hypothetical protein